MEQFMAPIEVKGTFDLEDLENKCGTIQNMVPCKLIRITKKTDLTAGKFNALLFEKVAIGSTPPEPKLIAITIPTDIPSIIAAQMQEDRKMVFDSIIFVQNVEIRVLGFR